MAEAVSSPVNPGSTSASAGGEPAADPDALVAPDPTDIEEAEEGKILEDERAEAEPEHKPAAAAAPKKKPAEKHAPAKKPGAKDAAAAKDAEADPEPEEPPEEEYEYEFTGEDGKSVKEKLTKAKVNELLARRKKLDAEAFKNITEANKLRGPVEQLFKQIKENPLAIYDIARLAGADPHDAAARYAQEWKRQQEMTPEQRQAEDQANALAQREAAVKAKEQEYATAERQQKFAEKRTKVLSSVTKALDAAQVPRHPIVLQIIGDHLAGQVHGKPDDFEPDFNLAVEHAQDGIRDATKSWLGGLSYDQLLSEVPDLVKTLRSGDAARAKSNPANRPGNSTPAPRPKPREQENEEPQFLSPAEWGDRMRGRKT